ncbi:MAG: PA2779 family protein [Deltaproteobacteria bacterium]|nr:PA2779 family protein [Deltaproteobacteria bacterium]MBZ0220648.1 PA2779 family protein [Deltaproteobacteria bacterium]
MKVVKSFYFRQVALVLAFTMLVLGSIPTKSMALVIGSDAVVAAAAEKAREADIARVQRVLESKLVADKLQQAGLSEAEINERLGKLSDAELHSFASQLESLYPGGDALSAIIALLIIVILVLVVLKLADRKIVIR